jgi:threonine dehydrogenase-like Zn-dependent dehydrogenase
MAKGDEMQTIVLNEPEHFVLTDTPQPGDPAPGQALVRVRNIGICGTDLHAYRGRQPFFSYPRILGHELGVEVVAVGDNNASLKPGDQCAVEPYLNCGHCIACRRGMTNCCTTLKVLGVSTDGGMREYITLPVNKLHKSEKLGLDQLAIVETLCIGAHAVSRAQPEPGETALVVGAGPIGLTVIEALKPVTSNIIV